MMELGATVCTARAARCGACPVAPWCASAGAPAGAAAAPRRRPRFEETDRYARGRIVAALLAGEPLPALEPERLERALAGLARDGLDRARRGRARRRCPDRARRARPAASAPPRSASTSAARTASGVRPRRRSSAPTAVAGSRISPRRTCSAPMWRSPRASASRSDSSSAFFAARENGAPAAAALASAPGPKVASTRRRTSSRSMPIAASASASSPPVARASARSARPSARARRARPGRPPRSSAASASRRCSAAIRSPPSAAASSSARSHGRARLLGEPLEHQPFLPISRRDAVLLVDRLLAHAEPLRDLLPAPALLARVRDLQRLERLEQRCAATRPRPARRPGRGRGRVGELRCLVHGRQSRLTLLVQPWLTAAARVTSCLAMRGQLVQRPTPPSGPTPSCWC